MQTWVLISEIIRNIGLALAAFGGLLLAWRKLAPELTQAGTAAAKAEVERRAHVVELFNRAAGQLSNDHLEVRLGAIYVLREVGRDFPDLADPVFELLQAHLRERDLAYGDAEPPIDVQAIIDTLRMRIVADGSTTE
jgi:hypothetical protein